MNNPYSSSSYAAESHNSEYESADSNDTILQRPGSLNEPSQQSARDMSVLGPSLTFKGDLVAGEDLLIQGRVEGSIRHTAQNLTIGPEGSVKASIRARNVVIQGIVQGDIYASEVVTVEASAKVRGNIFAPRISLQEGATFKGSIDMDATEDKAAAVQTAPKTATKKSTKRASKSKLELDSKDIDKILE